MICFRKLLFFFVYILYGVLPLCAQNLSFSYDGELQYDFGSGFQSVHLVWLEAEHSLNTSLSAQVSGFSLAMTHESPLVADLQGVSNLDAENTLFAIAVADLKWQINEKHSLYVGIRNMNEDYFNSSVSSFFCNPSCGIFPTISFNYPIANYPYASMGMHYSFKNEHFHLQSSLYNGIGYKRLTGRMNQFRFCPQGDGLFALAQVECRKAGNSFFLGSCVYDDVLSSTINSSVWSYAEPRVTDNLHLIFSYSHAFDSSSLCRDYAAIGCVWSCGKFDLGLHSDYARFYNAEEFATELTLQWSVNSYCTIQPVLYSFCNTEARSLASLLRVSIRL